MRDQGIENDLSHTLFDKDPSLAPETTTLAQRFSGTSTEQYALHNQPGPGGHQHISWRRTQSAGSLMRNTARAVTIFCTLHFIRTNVFNRTPRYTRNVSRKRNEKAISPDRRRIPHLVTDGTNPADKG
jgi:hypothetical protein